MTILVTGATGFIGGAVLRALIAAGETPLAGLRRDGPVPAGAMPFVTGDLADGIKLPPGVTGIVHAAGLGHRRDARAADYARANTTAAMMLADAADRAGVQKLVLVSTAHVLGRAPAAPVADDAPLAPADAYAESKAAAEEALSLLFGPRLRILRPVAVIGPFCPGNIPRLMRLIRTGLPLPFASLANRRSFVHADDLARLCLLALGSPSPREPMLAAHPEAISTPDLVRALAAGMGVTPRLVAMPSGLLGGLARLAGGDALALGLTGSFQAAPSRALALGWSPTAQLHQQLADTARYYNTTG